MSDKKQLLENLQGPIRAIQGVDWTVFSNMSSDCASRIGCLVNVYQRITPGRTQRNVRPTTPRIFGIDKSDERIPPEVCP